ncbi:MAG: hypothetical protein ACYSW7_11480 [Planctomycetota bacterium]
MRLRISGSRSQPSRVPAAESFSATPEQEHARRRATVRSDKDAFLATVFPRFILFMGFVPFC